MKTKRVEVVSQFFFLSSFILYSYAARTIVTRTWEQGRNWRCCSCFRSDNHREAPPPYNRTRTISNLPATVKLHHRIAEPEPFQHCHPSRNAAILLAKAIQQHCTVHTTSRPEATAWSTTESCLPDHTVVNHNHCRPVFHHQPRPPHLILKS